MRRLLFLILPPLLFIGCAGRALSSPQSSELSPYAPISTPQNGWMFLMNKLVSRGIPKADVENIFNDPRMPPPSDITFRLKPVESQDMYSKFRELPSLLKIRKFLNENREIFLDVESDTGVPQELIASILFVETHFGENTGTHLIFNRLARICSVGEPTIFIENFNRLKKTQPSLTTIQLQERVQYLEDTFLPELEGLFKLRREQSLDIFSLKGSIAGAFGIPQFLPTSFLRFGTDGDHDGKISLFSIPDAIASTGSFLKFYGWKSGLTDGAQRAVIWNYNHSAAYVDTVLWLASSSGRKRLALINGRPVTS